MPLKSALRSLLPAWLLSAYHFSLACLGAVLFRFPSRRLTVIAVTGTKGKSSTAEFISAILEAHGWETALSNSIRFKVGSRSEENMVGRSMPGRFFIQRLLSRARAAGCRAAILEMTSEGARQFRHRALELDALVFTNLAPEHIESHGSYENYRNAKFEIARQLMRSRKRPRIVVANGDDPESARYLSLPLERAVPFSLSSARPYASGERGGFFTLEGVEMRVAIPGEFSLKNALAAAHLCRAFGVPLNTIREGLARVVRIPGRADSIEEGQDFSVVVDYAYTPDSLTALLDTYEKRRIICVLGSAGGGRDRWKRPVMGNIAQERCARVILTTDDPYDDDPRAIIDEIAAGMRKAPEIIPDRRLAIRRALSIARRGDVVLITGKGVDPIAGPGGKKIPWNDVDVAREELKALLRQKRDGV